MASATNHSSDEEDPVAWRSLKRKCWKQSKSPVSPSDSESEAEAGETSPHPVQGNQGSSHMFTTPNTQKAVRNSLTDIGYKTNAFYFVTAYFDFMYLNFSFSVTLIRLSIEQWHLFNFRYQLAEVLRESGRREGGSFPCQPKRNCLSRFLPLRHLESPMHTCYRKKPV